jgi:hypothetical protein
MKSSFEAFEGLRVLIPGWGWYWSLEETVGWREGVDDAIKQMNIQMEILTVMLITNSN